MSFQEVNIALTVVPVQPQTCTVAPLYAKPSGRSVATVTTDWYPEYVQDHIKNLINSSVVTVYLFYAFTIT